MGWNDTLATIDVGARIHATRHCDKEGYDIIFVNMVKSIQEDEELEIYSNHCNEELILKGPKMHSSKTMSIIQENTVPNVPLLLVKMEITSIEDFKVHEESQVQSKGDTKQIEEYYDASNEFSSKEEIKTLKAKVTKRE